jgi:hypothetical protein
MFFRVPDEGSSEKDVTAFIEESAVFIEESADLIGPFVGQFRSFADPFDLNQ